MAWIDADLHQRLRIASAREDTSVTAVLRTAILNFVVESERAAERANEARISGRVGAQR